MIQKVIAFTFGLIILGALYGIFFCVPMYYLLNELEFLHGMQFDFYQSTLITVTISIIQDIPSLHTMAKRLAGEEIKTLE